MPLPKMVGVPEPRVKGQHFGIRGERARVDGAGQPQPLQGPHAAAARRTARALSASIERT